MVFSSLEFLFFFFPIVLGCYYILPKAARNYWLLAASLFFYAWGEPTFFFLLLISITVNYSFGLLLGALHQNGTEDPGKKPNEEKFILFRSIDPEKCRKGLFILVLLANFSSLFVFKYLNFITKTIRTVIPSWQGVIPQTSFILPLAISFYTFQTVSYIFDIYRGMPAEKNPCSYALFITFFPQLLQGPIIRYSDFRSQLEDRKTDPDTISTGIIRFLTGFNQKVLLADILSEVTDAAFKARELSVGMAWLGMLAYSLQLYFDFSGYSDMAIGLGEMFGFRFRENFDFPYASKNMTEFWRRWHISLGSWFRDYLYFPLGGSRVRTKGRIVLNLMIVWAATGIWHGADITFILWGILHGVVIVIEKLTDLPKRLERKPVAESIYRGCVILMAFYGWMLFRAAGFSQAVTYTKALFRLGGNPWRDSLFTFNLREYVFTFCFSVICAFPVCKTIRERISSHSSRTSSAVRLIWYLVQLVLAIVSVSGIVMSSHNPFLYANF